MKKKSYMAQAYRDQAISHLIKMFWVAVAVIVGGGFCLLVLAAILEELWWYFHP